MRVLVSVASKHDSTTGIGAAIAKTLRDAGIETEVVPPEKVASLDGLDAVILGSAVYYGRWCGCSAAVRSAAPIRSRKAIQPASPSWPRHSTHASIGSLRGAWTSASWGSASERWSG
jgi:hypothetical protein